MAIDFRCVVCGKLLRVGDEAAGRQAQCPQCGNVAVVPAATAPAGDAPAGDSPGVPPPPPESSPSLPDEQSPFAAGGPGPAPGADSANPYQSPTQYGSPPLLGPGFAPATAASRVAVPAIAMLVYGILVILEHVGCIGFGIFLLFASSARPGGIVRPDDIVMAAIFGGIGLIGLVLDTLIVVGAVKMRRLRSYGLAMAAAIISMIPTSPFLPCCLVWFAGVGFGIWSLVVLCSPEVKAGFGR